jgi:hypothetical protein
MVQGADGSKAAPRYLLEGPALIETIELWVEHWNDDPKPFVWHKTAEEIIENGATRTRRSPPGQITDGPLAGSRPDSPQPPVGTAPTISATETPRTGSDPVNARWSRNLEGRCRKTAYSFDVRARKYL